MKHKWFCILIVFLSLYVRNLIAFEIDATGQCRIDGKVYPAVGFGTFPLKSEVCYKAVVDAAKNGYRIIDTATFYGNFEPIGRALKEQGRSKFYLISKVWPDAQTPELLPIDLKKTLTQLQTPYLDAYLVHWPNSKIPIKKILLIMDDLRKRGLIRHIGLSNVTVNHLKRALECQVPISWVQVEMHPQFCDFELLQFCAEKGILVQAWGPLGKGSLADDPMLAKMGERYGKTASQIALRWVIQHGCLPLPGSKNPVHIRQNRAIMDFSLSKEEMQEIDDRAKAETREPVMENSGAGFPDEFDFCWP